MGNTNATLKYAFAPDGRLTEADSVVVSCIELDDDGNETGSNLVLVAPATTSASLTQYHPGLYELTTTNSIFERGKSYKATFSAYWQGDVVTAYDTETYTFVARSDSTSAAKSNSQLTLVDCRRIIRKCLGIDSTTTTEPASATVDEITNDAIERLWRDARWTFQAGDPFYIDFIVGQYRYKLPSDYLEVKEVYAPDSDTYEFIRKDVEWIRRNREADTSNPGLVTYWSVSWDPGASLTSSGAYFLDIWPTPTAYRQDAAVIDYQREAPKLSSTTDIVPIPGGYQSLVKAALRAEATSQENRPNAPYEEAKYQQILAATMRHDGRHRTPFIGSMRPCDEGGPSLDPENFIDPETEVSL